MTVPRLPQVSFAAGVLTPSLHSRVDLAMFATGLKTAKNAIVRPHGGVENRAGTEMISEFTTGVNWPDVTGFFGTPTGGVLVPFEFDAETNQTYQLVLGENRMGFIRNGSPIVSALATPTSLTNLNPGLRLNFPALTFPSPQFNRIFYLKFENIPDLNGVWVIADGGTATQVIVKHLNGDDIEWSGATTVTSGGLFEKYEIATPWPASALSKLVYAQENDVVYFTNASYPEQKLTRVSDTNWTLDPVTYAPSISAPTGVSVTVAPSGGTSANAGYIAKTYTYKVAAISATNGDESLPSAADSIVNDLLLAGGKNRITWTAVSGSTRYVVYKRDNGIYGYIGSTTGLTFDDDNITADLAQAPQQAVNHFNGAGRYPAVVTFDEQRKILGGPKANPSAMFHSQSGFYDNFGTASPSTARDAISYRIRAKQKNQIRAVVSLKKLHVFTSSAEYIVTGGQEDFLTPANVKPKQQSNYGSGFVQPLIVGDTILFIQARGGAIRDMTYDYSQDGFAGNNLTIKAEHYFRGRKVKSWDYQQIPYSVIWVVLDDGAVLSFTYVREHQVWAWCRHDFSGGVVEDVSVVAEGTYDVPYFIVRRFVYGQGPRYIERMKNQINRNWFVDSGLALTVPNSSDPVTVISGLRHLEGRSVVAVADGNVVRDLTVMNGKITLPEPARVIVVGLGYESLIETLPLNWSSAQGSQGRELTVGKLTIQVENTRSMEMGMSPAAMMEWQQRQNEPYDVAVFNFTGDIEFVPPTKWTKRDVVAIRQKDPLPMAVLAVVPEVKIGG